MLNQCTYIQNNYIDRINTLYQKINLEICVIVSTYTIIENIYLLLPKCQNATSKHAKYTQTHI